MSLSIPREVVETFPERLQRLVSYDLAAPYLGFVELDDPHKLLEDATSIVAGATDSELETAAGPGRT